MPAVPAPRRPPAEVTADGLLPLHELAPLQGLLALARQQLGLDVAFLGRFDGDERELTALSSDLVLPVPAGAREPAEQTHCGRLVAGRMPAVVPDVLAVPAASAGLPAVEQLGVRSFAGVPVRLSGGRLFGTLCCVGFTPAEHLDGRDERVLAVLATAVAAVVEDHVEQVERVEARRRRLLEGLAAGGPRLVLQPVVDLDDGSVVGHEALSRFEHFPAPHAPVEQEFADAAEVGLGAALDAAVLRSAGRLLARHAVPGYLAVNVNPGSLVEPAVQDALTSLPLGRVVLEVTEHHAVGDYAALGRLLRPFRDAGMRLAVDDAGAGYASLRHVLDLAPDVVKLDRSLVADVEDDPARQALAFALVAFTASTGAQLVAEGVEREGQRAALRGLGVRLGQGFLLGRPAPAEQVLAVAR